MITIGIASDNFRHDDRGVVYVFQWCKENGCDTVEINTIDGEDFFEGLGFSPAIPLSCDGVALREKLGGYGLSVSQLDCHFALHRWQSIPYMIKGIQLAKVLDCPYIATTDGAEVPEGMTLEEVYERARYHLREALAVARTHNVGINIEPHGPLTTNQDLMVRLMKEIDDTRLGVNFDTGNSFVAGRDPVKMTRALLPWIRHFHVKDVAPELAASVGEETGIAASEVYVGEGINADNIRAIVELLKSESWDGVMSLESKGEVNTLKSLEWFRDVVG
jgi:sugar phosphate isomerase/epimerase